MDDPARLTAWVQGRVQGVWFRYWVRSRAQDLGLRGSAMNLIDGRVAEGPRPAWRRCSPSSVAMMRRFVGAIVQSLGEPVGEPGGFRVG